MGYWNNQESGMLQMCCCVDNLTVTSSMIHIKSGITQAVFWVYDQLFHLGLAMSDKIFKCRNNPNNCLKFLKDVYRAYFDLAQGDHGHRIKYVTIALLCLPNLWTEKRWFSPLAFPWSDKNQMTIQRSFAYALLILVASNQSNCQTMI